MRLRELELRNWRRHGHLKLRFKTGVTCILGKNGSGKSSLLDAIKYSLTGDWGPGYDKAANIRENSQGEASVYAEWLHGEVQFAVHRNLRAGKSSLKIIKPAPASYSGSKQIDIELARVLGFDVSSLLDMVFIPQNGLTEFTKSRARWLDSIASLCGIAHVQAVQAAISARLSKDQSGTAAVLDVDVQFDELLVELENEESQLSAELQAAEMARMLPTQAASLRADLATHRVLAEQESRRHRAAGSLRGLQRRCQDGYARELSRQVKWRQLISRLDVYLESRQDKRDLAAGLLRTGETRSHFREKLQELAEELPRLQTSERDLDRQLGKLQTENTSLLSRDSQLAAAIAAAEAKLQQLSAELQTFATGLCPTCGQPATIDLQSRQAELESETQLQAGRKKSLRELADRQRTVTASLRDVGHKLRLCRSRLASAQAEQKAAEAGLKTAVSDLRLEKAARFIDRYNVLSQRRAALHNNLTASSLLTVRYTERIESYKRELTKVAAATKGLKVPSRTAEELQQLLQRGDQTAAKISELQARQPILRQRRQSLLAKQQAYAEKRAKFERQQRWLGDLDRWRQVLHRDSLQKLVIRGYLYEITETINKHLKMFAAPFSVLLDEEQLAFVAQKSNGVRHAITQLSGGQLVLLGVAYHLAINTQNIIVLDEPTANLDREKVQDFGQFLQRLNVILRKQNKQLLLVTHEESLLDSTGGAHGVFSDIVRL